MWHTITQWVDETRGGIAAVIMVIGLAFIALAKFVGKQTLARITAIENRERDYVTKDDLQQVADRLESAMHLEFNSMRKRIDSLYLQDKDT